MNSLDFSPQVKSLEALERHPVPTVKSLHPRKPVLRVRNDHFHVESLECRYPNGAVLFGNQSNGWHQAGQKEMSLFDEGIQTALYALYVLNIPSGECVVQRESPRAYSVHHISIQENKGFHLRNRPSNQEMSFGADVECLLKNQKTGGFVSASSLASKEGEIGYDDAIAVMGKKVIHPILELRPKPAASGSLLHANLLRIHERTEQFLRENHLRAETSAFGRFLTGGHIHVGHCSLSFQHARLLDVYLAIPFALTEYRDACLRRKRFGRLGSVRTNAFSGFEYRVLSSWYNQIPEFLPVLEWFCYILEHAEQFPLLDFSDEVIIGYYENDLLLLQEVFARIEKICLETLPQVDFVRYAEPFFQLIRQKGDVL